MFIVHHTWGSCGAHYQDSSTTTSIPNQYPIGTKTCGANVAGHVATGGLRDVQRQQERTMRTQTNVENPCGYESVPSSVPGWVSGWVLVCVPGFVPGGVPVGRIFH